ncbi:MAG: DNA helicase [Planctomycetota bacterium]|nr:MAG: DNA helicase [Planctomycetota bacterium]REK25077.1 MAG: DNA helicase [Planctomycetota bacterium]REK28142.1 MAG: DNA helicase [Planctomycetota bacterium]
MNFRISDTFTDSLSKLTGQEQKAVKTTAFDLQLNPASPGMQFHRIDRSRDANFWSIRVSGDIRLIVHKTSDSLLLCYVDHHDDAYDWAERRKIERHPRTGAAQLVEVRETVKEITIPRYVEIEQPAPPEPRLFENLSEEELLNYGVPDQWLDDVRVATEDSLFELADHLPREAAEALLELATGGSPQVPAVVPAESDPFAHPDALSRFRVMTSVEEFQQALDYPWEKWTVFLHPSQRSVVERHFNGPARVSGSAGTGKTIVALHRAVYLARQCTDASVLLTTFSETLAKSLQRKLDRLVGNHPELAQRIHVHSITDVGGTLYENLVGALDLATEDTIRELLIYASGEAGPHKFSDRFLWTEWSDVVDAWQLRTWDEYRDVARLGRKTRLGEKQRDVLWSIFSRVLEELERHSLLTMPAVFRRVAKQLASESRPPFDFAVIDESQDLSVPELRFLAALGASCPNGLFFAGDLGQRIFQTPFSWKSLGVDVRGRSHTLRVNYRTSHQIRSQADRLLPPELSDVDENIESRRGTVSVFNGPGPVIEVFDDPDAESTAVGRWIADRLRENLQPHEIAIFVRSSAELPRAHAAVDAANAPAIELDENVETRDGNVSLSTMHLAKGLEFRAVAVMACDDEVIPSQQRIETVTDDSDLEEVYNTERHLLYVACTRARDHLLVTGVDPASEFLDDLRDR